MLVVADASPINYLVLIDQADVLPVLFGKVLLPEAVYLELRSQESPVKVSNWMAEMPEWMEVRGVTSIAIPSLSTLDAGEREAIELALQLGIHRVLIDEAEGRKQAELFRLTPRGTLGVLEDAAQAGLLHFRSVLKDLLITNFRVSSTLVAEFIARNP